MEEWRWIREAPGYQVSSYGRVRSVRKLADGKISVKLIKQSMHRTGYCIVCLSVQGQKHMYRVHRLVAQAFIANPNNKPVVNHKDEVKTHNYVKNLEWATISENTMWGSGRKKSVTNRRTDAKTAPHRVAQFTKDGKLVRVYPSIASALRSLGRNVDDSNLSKACRGERQTFAGYKWRLVS